MHPKITRQIARTLVQLCELLPLAKPFVEKWGLRTKKEWFGDRVAGVQMPDGTSFKLASIGRNYLSFELFWRGVGYYEPISRLVVQELVRPGDTFIDLGANIGFYSLVVSVTRPQVSVISFEPNPRNYALLTRNARVNDLAMICEPLAISDRDGTATLYLSASDMSASLRSDFEDHADGEAVVRTTTLDSYLQARPISGRLVIKVDVEGHEEAFFRGARNTLAARRPDIITEVTLNYSREAVALLKSLGYRFYQVTDEGLLEAATLAPKVRGNFVFLNYLLSAQPREKVAALFQRIAPAVQRIDLTRTSKCLAP
ncbi:MAG TPA: FkbM family methyltransferase, partial [Vicinamibacterales bacterium]|nr:FkbM family methyltransferase [Vicinamibacterales bacterium]